MDIFLPEGFRPSKRAHSSAGTRARRLHVKAGDVLYPVLRCWDGGFAVDATCVPVLAGPVDLYDATEHIAQYVIRRCDTVQSERTFTVRRAAAVNYAAAPEMDQDLQGEMPEHR